MELWIDRLSRWCAIVAGVVIVLITLVTTGSIVGRWLFGKPLLGDTELVEFGMAVAVAAFLPLCQWRGGNIIVDFFTTRSTEATRSRLDRFGALLVALMLALLAWRTALGALDKYGTGDTTMLLQWHHWIAYSAMVPPLALTALLALYTAITGRNGARGPDLDDAVPPGTPAAGDEAGA